MTQAELEEKVAKLERRLDVAVATTIWLFRAYNGQRVDEFRLRALIEELGIATISKKPGDPGMPPAS